jgi:hypothetical protein
MPKNQFAPLSAGMLMKEPSLAEKLNRVTREAEALKPKISQTLQKLKESGNRFEYKASPSIPPDAIVSATENLTMAFINPSNIQIGPNGEIEVAFSAPSNGQSPYHLFEINGKVARVQSIGMPEEDVKILLAEAKAISEIESLDQHSSAEPHIKLIVEHCARSIAEALEGIEPPKL